MRLRVINPNTTASMTGAIGAAARAVAAPGTEVEAVNPTIGPASIEGHYDEAMALPGLLAEVRRGEAEGANGFAIACFGDPGLGAAREAASGPVVGIAEAAMHAAALVAPSFAVVTTLKRTEAIAEHLVHAYGMERRCRRVRSTEIAVLDLDDPASDARARVLVECRRAIEEDGAEAIILGCAGMADLARDLTGELGVPVIDGVSAAVKLLEALVGMGLKTAKNGAYARPLPKAYAGSLAPWAP